MDRQLCDTSVIVKMDNNRDLDMESIIKNVECWYQEIAQKSKEEVDAFYQTRVSKKQPGRPPGSLTGCRSKTTIVFFLGSSFRSFRIREASTATICRATSVRSQS